MTYQADAALTAAIEADAAALAAASALAEEALALQREAIAVLTEGWSSESGSAAVDLLRQQGGDGADLVAALHCAAAEFRSLRDALEVGGSVPDVAQTTARINDRPQPNFPALAPPPGFPGPTAWPGSGPSAALPDFGGVIAGLVAAAADALSPDGVAGPPPADPVETDPGTPPPRPPAVPEVRAQQIPEIPAAPSLPPEINDPVPRSEPQPQAEPEPQRQPQPEPAPAPEVPLLAAERPPEPPAAPLPTPAPPPESVQPRTPCEIAADELPQVGR